MHYMIICEATLFFLVEITPNKQTIVFLLGSVLREHNVGANYIYSIPHNGPQAKSLYATADFSVSLQV